MDNIIFTSIPLKELVEAISLEVSKIISKNEGLNPIKLEEDSKDFLTIEETAKMCKVKSHTTLWNWRQNGKLVPMGKAGKKPLYRHEDIVAFLER